MTARNSFIKKREYPTKKRKTNSYCLRHGFMVRYTPKVMDEKNRVKTTE